MARGAARDTNIKDAVKEANAAYKTAKSAGDIDNARTKPLDQ